MNKSDLLSNAIKMEEEGKKYYLLSAEKTKNILGKKLFEKLAEYEDLHIKKIKEVFDSLNENKKIGFITSISGDVKELRKNIFSEEIKNIDKNVKIDDDDLSALKEGMRLEEKSENYYMELAKKTNDFFEKRFYLTLSYEERGHYLLLFDSLEYLTNPELWFLLHEKPTLDGG
jgi:rubrerythrin